MSEQGLTEAEKKALKREANSYRSYWRTECDSAREAAEYVCGDAGIDTPEAIEYVVDILQEERVGEP